MSDQHQKLLFSAYDVASAGYTYGLYGRDTASGPALITAGSNVLVTEVNAIDDPFTGFGIGDILNVRGKDGAVTTRTVSAVPSIPNGVTVGTAVDWSTAGGTAFTYRRWQSGTTAEIGWFSTGEFLYKSFEIVVAVIAATSVDYSIEGRSMGGTGVTHAAAAITVVGSATVNVATPFDQMRLGLKVTVDGGVQSVTAVFYGVPNKP